MSTRERWIVYPLIFLTLGIALRNQFLPTRRFGALDLQAGELSAQKISCYDLNVMQNGECKQLSCGQLQFNQALGKHIRAAGLAECLELKAAQAECRAMFIVDADGKPVVMAGSDKNTQAGVIQTMRSNGAPLVQIHGTDSGGVVATIGHGGRVFMGLEGRNFGVFAQFPQFGLSIPLTPPWRFDPQTGAPKPPQSFAPTTPQQKGKQP